jgi:hypothetical protein
MRGSGILSLAVSAMLATIPAAAFAHGPMGHAGRHGVPIAVGPSIFVSPLPPGFAPYSRGWGVLGRPAPFGALPNGFAVAPFHSPYAPQFLGGNPGVFAKPDEASVLESESRMEQQIRAIEEAPDSKAKSPEDEQDSVSDSADWQPL